MKTTILILLAILISTAAMAQATPKDTAKVKPNTDTLVVPASAKFIKIKGKPYDLRAFDMVPIFLSAEVLEFVINAMINGQQPAYDAQKMQDHITITQQLQQALKQKK